MIRFAGIGKLFGAVEAVRPTDLTVAQGEFFTLLGPSGSGKTTLLNVTAGYVAPTVGRVFIGPDDVTDLPPRRRNVGMVFQSYALFPHLDVFENVAYGLRARRVPAPDIRRRVAEALATLQLDGLGDRRIAQLSGGQQQRVALARALVIEPSVLLMDEPLGALDRQLRKQVQLELRHLHQRMGRTTLYVTHDQEEALVLSDRIGVMRAGRLEQVGTARELYERPASVFVAGFLGESNLLAGQVTRLDGDRAELRVPGWPAPVRGVAAPGLRVGEKATALVRPEHVRIGSEEIGAPDAPESVEARVEEVVYLGDMVALRLLAPGSATLWCRRFARDGVPAGGTVKTGFGRADVRILPD
jgi:ABC-type Fe3+/spermidine/putrescine transport system ATPase subunit